MTFRLKTLSQLLLSLVTLGYAAMPLKDFNNPIISGFAPDPSCVRVDDQFFCVSSSFSAFPGIPVYTSRDLVNWQQIGMCLFASSRDKCTDRYFRKCFL